MHLLLSRIGLARLTSWLGVLFLWESASAQVLEPVPSAAEALRRDVHVVGLLLRGPIRRELKIEEQQAEQLRQIDRETRELMRTTWQEVQNLPVAKRWQAIRERMGRHREQVEGRVSDILLDHQSVRLKQLQLQARVRRGGTVQALASEEIRAALGLSDKQLAELRRVGAKAELTMRKKVREAVQEARGEVLKTLTPQQQAKWWEMVGQPFDFAVPDNYVEQRTGR
jgi:hypothetical protein